MNDKDHNDDDDVNIAATAAADLMMGKTRHSTSRNGHELSATSGDNDDVIYPMSPSLRSHHDWLARTRTSTSSKGIVSVTEDAADHEDLLEYIRKHLEDHLQSSGGERKKKDDKDVLSELEAPEIRYENSFIERELDNVQELEELITFEDLPEASGAGDSNNLQPLEAPVISSTMKKMRQLRPTAPSSSLKSPTTDTSSYSENSTSSLGPWLEVPSNNFYCKKFLHRKNGDQGGLCCGKVVGIVHTSAQLFLANFWLPCTRRRMALHVKQNGSEYPRSVYKK